TRLRIADVSKTSCRILDDFCFFSSRRRHTRSKRDWSSDVCSSDLTPTFRPVRSPFAPFRAASVYDGGASGREVESRGSWPEMASCSRAESSTVREHGPAWSRLEARAITPYRDTPP